MPRRSRGVCYAGPVRRVIAVLVGLAAAAPPVWAAPKGQVVRVERSGVTRISRPLMCNFEGNGGTSLCYGLAPRVGAVGVVFDGERRLGLAVVTSTTSEPSACPVSSGWNYQHAPRGAPVRADGAWIVFDAGLDLERAAVVPSSDPSLPQERSNWGPWLAVDRDGDALADLVVYTNSCDHVAGTCFEHWVADRARRWQRVRTDVYRSC